MLALQLLGVYSLVWDEPSVAFAAKIGLCACRILVPQVFLVILVWNPDRESINLYRASLGEMKDAFPCRANETRGIDWLEVTRCFVTNMNGLHP
jgi:hypothetical protein